MLKVMNRFPYYEFVLLPIFLFTSALPPKLIKDDYITSLLTYRCAKCVRTTTRRLDLGSLNIRGNVDRIDCIDGNHFVTMLLNDEIIDVDKTYSDQLENKWLEARTDRDKLLYYVLSQIIYPQYDTPRPEKLESLYAVADPLDIVFLRWRNGTAIGFYTIKPTGTEIFLTKEKYTMPVVDTAYIRSSYRNKGFGTEILYDVTTRFPNEDIGFSKPISNGMLKILKIFLINHKRYRLRFWEIADYDVAGSQQLIWCHLRKTIL